MPELLIQESRDEDGDPKVLYLEGFVDSATYSVLEKKLTGVLEKKFSNIVIDLGKLSYIGSSGISVFLQYSATIQADGGKLILCNVPDKAKKVIAMVGLENVVRIFPSQKEALEFLQVKKEEPPPKPAPDPAPVAEAPQAEIKAVEFPIEKECPHCKQPARVPRADIIRCPSCKSISYVNAQGDIYFLTAADTAAEAPGMWFHISVPSNITYLNSIRAFLTSILKESGLQETDTDDIELAVDEAAANVMEHAYGMDKTKRVDISFLLSKEFLLVKLHDTGNSFDITAKINEEEKQLTSQNKRGRGCYLIRQVVDRLEYQSIPQYGNELIILRYFKNAPPAK